MTKVKECYLNISRDSKNLFIFLIMFIIRARMKFLLQPPQKPRRYRDVVFNFITFCYQFVLMIYGTICTCDKMNVCHQNGFCWLYQNYTCECCIWKKNCMISQNCSRGDAHRFQGWKKNHYCTIKWIYLFYCFQGLRVYKVLK